ncbi:rod shape-determining protein MreD [Altererythrobacter aerius]|uniref:Rod shape-determining protein MreD n=2 Tax=Tsuneonella aeria TaxID=1837929 RepID=A0A6I4T9G9_9SPHN|nr:rod shape-determining protein MreD [Tsuneonella aeria]MXO73822.1 rod shape-determining protein MreD [Tsuneonella aeria]
MLGSLIPQLPIASAVPLMPPLGYLLLLSWRFVRPGLLPVWAGFPLGLFDDLFSGQPFGSAIALWSVTMLGMELFEARFPWRGFFQDWLVAGVIVTWYLVIAALFSGGRVDGTMLLVLLPQIVLSVSIIPLLSRLVAGLDRFRLSRVRVLG